MGDTNAAVAWCSFSPEIGKYLFTACETLSLIDETGFPPRRFNPQNKLPGAINMSFYDGHVEQVKLDRLWSLDWHKDYVAPLKRPGL
jgi:prepilin-type processing-associated H-X9-DG protein